MNDNIIYLLLGIGTFIYGWISHTKYRNWHRKKIGYDDKWSPVLIKTKGIIIAGGFIIVIQLLKILKLIQ